MANLLYVRTGSTGTGPDFLIADLGKPIPTGTGWTLLSSSSPSSAETAGGEFTARQLRDSKYLYDGITNGDLEWSKDGSTVELAGDYVADYMMTQDLTDDSLEINNLTVSGTISTPNGDIVAHLDGGSNKHDASEIDVEGTYPNISTSPGNLEAVISGINDQLGNVSAYSFANIATDNGTAVADAAADTLTIVGADGILVGAAPSTDTVTISGTALLPRDGSRPMTGDLDLGGNSINNVLDITVSGLADISAGELVLPVDTVAPTGAEGKTTVIGDIQYVYDSVRTKWLSVSRIPVVGTKSGSIRNAYTFVGLVAMSAAGFRVPRNATIVSITAQTDGSFTWTAQLKKNGSATVLGSLAITSAAGGSTTTTDVDLTAGDRLQFYVSASSNIESPVIWVELAWRV